ncbi:MAG: L,D-transpeptidase family protein [Xanthobacteraceae bacterium]|nr:L,D-transpeptidase family protein [Xanthobacteraceae bacterium]
MSASRFSLLLATTAIVMVLAGPSHNAFAGPTTDADIAAAVPMPESANLAPPTVDDLATVTEQATGASSPIPSFPADRALDAPAPDIAAPAVIVPARPTATLAPPAPVQVMPVEAAPAPAPVVPAAAPVPAATPAPAAETPAVEAPPAAPLTLDQRIAQKVQELIGTKGDRILDRKYKAAVEAFYQARSYAPVWIDDGTENKRAKAAAAYLGGVDADGLDPVDYIVPSFAGDEAALAEAELKMTASVLLYARHASTGRIHYSRVSPDILYNLVTPEPAEVLGKIIEAKNVAQALDGFEPPHAAYKALKAKLAEARGGGASGRISNGQALKVGMDDPRVTTLRARFGLPAASDTTYDKALADAVRDYQKQRNLKQTGVFDNTVVDALNGPRREHEADIIIANMERWRWMPRDLGKAYVMVNIPEYILRVYDHGSLAWQTRVVVGLGGAKATPLLTETMKYITVNPTWHVPQSIVHHEYLPALAQDPTVLARMGLYVSYGRDGSVSITQPPGAGNALGRIRFNFPNKFSVYQHDTPDKYMFAHERRAYSHGCMRVQDPDKYAEVLLHIANPGEGYTAERIRAMYGAGERDIQLQYQIPVHLTYQTAYVDGGGHLVIREDIYGRDAKLISLLKSEERRVADQPTASDRREASASSSSGTSSGTSSGYAAAPRRQVMRQSPSYGLFGLFR